MMRLMKRAMAVLALLAGLPACVLATTVDPASPQPLQVDTPSTTVAGHTFIAPKGWSMVTRAPAVLLSPPEGDALVALVDLQAADPDAAVEAAWKAAGAIKRWPLKLKTDAPGRDGWQKFSNYDYETSLNDRRVVLAAAASSSAGWSVVLIDVDQAVWDKRSAQFATIFDRFMPKGHQRESFAGRAAHKLDADRIDLLKDFVSQAQREFDVPGVALGIVQNGRVVYAGGLGVRELGKPETVDADTLFMIASNTKAMTTLMLAKLVDAGKLNWTTPVSTLLPGFALGDAKTSARVQVQHLICACTGLPRQDYEWLVEFENATAQSTLQTLATMQPTSDFGALYQYSNPLASAGGYVGGHVAYPKLELGAAYDRAMQELVFKPLRMKATTFDFKRALRANHASPHAWNLQSHAAIADMGSNFSIVPMRPAGGAWSNVNDMLRYVQMELDEGALPDGRRYVSKSALLERRRKQVGIGNDGEYGMGLHIDHTWGVPVVFHGGSMTGYKSDMMWLPEHNVGAVILTNSDLGRPILAAFQRRLLEVLFDGKPHAVEDITARAKEMRVWHATENKRLITPADPAVFAKLAARYRNAALGELSLRRDANARTTLDFGEWSSAIASRHNDDGTDAIVTTTPGVEGIAFVIDNQGPLRKLVLRDNQHDYVFEEMPASP